MPVNNDKLKISIKILKEEEKTYIEFIRKSPCRNNKVSVKKKPVK